MKVKEMIASLSKCNQDAIVITSSSNFELRYAHKEAFIYEARASRVRERFRDAFDNKDYTTEVYRPISSKTEGDPVVVVSA